MRARAARSQPRTPATNAPRSARGGRRAVSPAGAARDAPQQHAAAARSLPPAVLRQMGRAIGHDFSDVRVHQDGIPAALGAVAMTRGTDVHFAPGTLRLDSHDGRALLGHELAHVMQQARGRVPTPAVGAKPHESATLEAEADVLGERAAAAFPSTPATGGAAAPFRPAVLSAPASDGARVAPVQLKSKAWKRRRRAELARQAAIRDEFRNAAPARREELLAAHYRVPPHLPLHKQIAIRKHLARVFGFSKDTMPGSGLGMDGWHAGQEEIVGGHHKLPKRSLGFAYSRMTEEQRAELRRQLHLPPGAGHQALARLRSNIVPRGPGQVAPEMRADDPEHTGEGLDTVVEPSGAMTPRSRVYTSLAVDLRKVHARLSRLAPGATMSADEAASVTGHLREAEERHFDIEGGLDAAHYGGDLWRSAGAGRYAKGPAAIPPTARVAGAFDEAHARRREEQREHARLAAERRRAEEREREEAAMARLRARWARDAERARQQKAAGTYDPSVGRDAIGKSARFW